MNPSPTLSDLENLARQAGEILRSGYGQVFEVMHKGLIDLVTEYDHRSETFLIESIQRQFPGHRLFTEESGRLGGGNGPEWYVDPLDGTVNFAHGLPIFAVSIGYAEQGKMQLGVVYDPMRDELYCAARGRGAQLNGRTLQASSPLDLDHSLLVTGFPYDIRITAANNLEEYRRFSLCSRGVRRLGSAAIDLCYVAAGRLDGYWELNLSPWDVAAGGLIAEESGAMVTRCNGAPDYIGPPASILAAAPTIHADMLRVLNQ